jgi:ATP-dependent Clp protease ATP-binding subunit ClpB
MTSNVGSEYILEHTEQNKMENRALDFLRATFRPEFLNRIDATIVFHRLSKEMLRNIVDIQLRCLQPLFAQRNIQVELTDKARDLIAQVGFDPAFGARPLKRAFREMILEPISEKILAEKIRPGDQLIVDRVQNDLVIRKSEQQKAVA